MRLDIKKFKNDAYRLGRLFATICAAVNDMKEDNNERKNGCTKGRHTTGLLNVPV